ncbi:baseplate J/gp47 family protein [Sphingomonas sp. LB-2]|uniref:baseplate J/gp47 family protein n=1 Tax=Sphingomonas caeni TaxID=2984949 RepID=UPI00222F3820|nr:baseplate J/gp47 family protein [Sphingomonas caeni]MCW3846493.1 baseplate J/gp47 family protein [Sphingomonas caeni]
MTGLCIACGSERRRLLVRNTKPMGVPILNGIDFVEVSPSQTLLTITFIHPLNAVAGAPTLEALNFRIEGGKRIRPIRIVGFSKNVAAGTVTLTVSEPGDFSLYRLRLVSGLGSEVPPHTFDIALSAVDIDFKAACPNPFDCKPGDPPPRSPLPPPVIDYLAKDYPGIRRQMLERMSVTTPSWTERNPADMGVMLIEALAQTADDLSYFQDAVATEAYLSTARKRSSIRRLARLLDYRLDEGLSARTWVVVDPVDAGKDGFNLVAPKRLQTESLGPPDSGAEPPVMFETLHDRTIRLAHASIAFHTWSGQNCCLPRGATRASLADNGLVLKPGDALLLRLIADPVTGQTQMPDPRMRQVVRLTEVEGVMDRLTNTPTLSVAWDAEDALGFDLPLVKTDDLGVEVPLADANANVILAEQGAHETRPAGSGAIARDTLPRRVRLPGIRIAVGVPYDDTAARKLPATAALRPDRSLAVPRIYLDGDNLRWEAVPDLLGANPSSQEFVVESGGADDSALRFGDGRLGREPGNPVGKFTLHFVAGIGVAGNIGADTLTVVPGVTGVRATNPLPAEGARDPEPLAAVRLAAPYAFKRNRRCVTPEDYAAKAETFPGVQRAKAYRAWARSWYSTFIVIDRVDGAELDMRFIDALLAYIEPERMAGDDLAVVPPRRVPLDIALRVCLAKGYRARDVELALRRALGTQGFFDPDRFSFGDPVYLSALIATAAGVNGIDHVSATRFQRWGRAAGNELDTGVLPVGEREIVSCDNDANFPENGRLELQMVGGL